MMESENLAKQLSSMLNSNDSDGLQNLAMLALAKAVAQLCRWCIEGHTSCEHVCQKLQMLYQRFVPHTLANLVTKAMLTAVTSGGPVLPGSIQNLSQVVCAVLHPGVTELHLPSATLHALASQNFPTLINLRVLELSGVHYRTYPRARSSLRGLVHLETVIYHYHCTDEFIHDLASCCEKLRRLYIRGSIAVTLQSSVAVRQLLNNGLEDLDVAWTKLDVLEVLLALTPPSNMRYSVPPMPYSLRRLVISSVKAKDINTMLDSGLFPKLVELSMSVLCPNAPLQANRATSLVSLEIIHCALSPDLLQVIGPQLRELQLRAVSELDIGRLTRTCGAHLKRLVLSSCWHVEYSEDMKNCRVLDQFVSLYSLRLDSLFPQEDIRVLAYCAAAVQVVNISLDDPHETVTFMTALPHLPNLREFSLRSHWGRGLLTMNLIKRLVDLCPKATLLEGIDSDTNIEVLKLDYPGISFQH